MSRVVRASLASILLLSVPLLPALVRAGESLPRAVGPARPLLAGLNSPYYSVHPEGLVRPDGQGGWWFTFAGPDSGARVMRVDGALQPRPGFGGRGRTLSRQSSTGGLPAQLLDDGAGGVYALWENGYAVQARRVLPDGDFAPGWEDEFLHWSFTPGYYIDHPSAVSLGEGGVMITHARTPTQAPFASRQAVATQYFRADGTTPFLWDPVFARVVTPAPGAFRVESCGDAEGGVYATWFEHDTLSDTLRVRLIRYRPTSVPSPGWSPRGTIVDLFVSPGGYIESPPRLVADGTGGVTLVWAHRYRGARAQRFLGDSLPQWGEGGRVLALFGGTNDARIVEGLAGSRFVAWNEGNRTLLLRIGGDGAPAAGWSEPRAIFADIGPFGSSAWIAPDGQGGLYAWQLLDWTAWPDPRRTLRLLRLDADGAPAPGWGPSGLACDSVVTTSSNVVVGVSPGGLLALWTHSPDGSYGPLMALLVSPEGVSIDPATRLPPALAVLSAGPSPMRDDFTMRFRSGQAQRLDADVYDLLGRRVRALERGLALPAGDHQVRWDGRDALGERVRPGVYVVRLRSGAGIASSRVVAGL